MSGRDNKPAEENRNGCYSGISRIKQSLNSRILEESSARDKCLKVVSGMRLVKESVGNKSAKFYRPCLKLGSIQSEVVLNKGIHCKNYKDGIAELNKGSLNYSEENKLGEGSYGNVHHGDFDGVCCC